MNRILTIRPDSGAFAWMVARKVGLHCGVLPRYHVLQFPVVFDLQPRSPPLFPWQLCVSARRTLTSAGMLAAFAVGKPHRRITDSTVDANLSCCKMERAETACDFIRRFSAGACLSSPLLPRSSALCVAPLPGLQVLGLIAIL